MKKEQIEKKAEELGIKYQTPCHGVGDCEFEARQAATEMADWLLSHQWVSVEDELPNDIPNCFVAYKAMKNVLYSTGSYEKYNDVWYVDGFGYNADVTHWMHIPPLAEEGCEKK